MRLKKINLRDYGVIIGFVVLCVAISIASPTFLTSRNILNLLRQSAVVGILSAGMTLVIISGNFDISVGYICGCAGAIMAKLMSIGVPIPAAILAALLAGAVIGVCSGVAVAKFGIPSMIATLATGQIINGVLLLVTGGYPISVSNRVLDFVGKESVLGIPVPIYLFLISIILVNFILKKLVTGRHIYSVGGNDEASRLSGVSVNKIKIIVFVISSMLAAFSGVVLTARVGTATATAGVGYELDAIAAVVIGGTNVAGGEGNAWKTIVGVLFMSVIANSFNLLEVHVYFQFIFKGLIILFAVGFDSYNRIKRGKN
ncbi:ribose transport system permease protein [Aequitasia blattaphilus]|uniref:ABC transporter permease n=1 Tax=Aequitasia blattaphilus TaxID=2949332 RepID=A0ABT1ECN0_9FIRM|nr:ABC transporter permease [Aequitasia blattaphilus]MCP1102707.1 ABC transporter permease [Aequitasia blattaphilus]MCR8615347.1 ABC transporter permease [Aequitasia blattaphilus]